jgi:hypothetical protein
VGVLNKEKALPRWCVASGFFVSIPSNSKLLSGCQQKSPDASHQGFFFVAEEGFEPPTFGL